MTTTKNNLITIILLVLITSCFTQLDAQEYEYISFPTKNAIWSEMFYYFGGGDFYPSDTMIMKYALFSEDTVIYGHLSKAI